METSSTTNVYSKVTDNNIAHNMVELVRLEKHSTLNFTVIRMGRSGEEIDLLNSEIPLYILSTDGVKKVFKRKKMDKAKYGLSNNC